MLPLVLRLGFWVRGTVLIGLAALGFSRARADDYVVISAAAIPQYDRNVKGRDGKKLESYVFSPGRHFTAATYDTSDEKVTFNTIAGSLAPALAQQKYFPAKDPKVADLLIIVHWGTTRVYDDTMRERLIEQKNAINDPSALNHTLLEIEADASLQQRYMALNADLLGYRRNLRTLQTRYLPSEDEKTMYYELSEERYFVVLMAYDYNVFKTEKRRHLMWTTHMNVRSAGNNFLAAVPQMARVAANYFGRDQHRVVHVFTPLHEGSVDVGTPRVVPSGL